MKKLLLLVALFFLPMTTYASCNISHTSGLSDEQIQQLKVQCEQMKLANAPANKVEEKMKGVDPETISTWASIAQEVAKALGVAAREVGVSVNEFIKTPAGWLVVAIVLWTFLISDIIMIVLCVLSIWFLLRRIKLSKIKSYDVTEMPSKIFGLTRVVKTPVYNDDIAEGDAWVIGISAVVTIVMMIITMVNVG